MEKDTYTDRKHKYTHINTRKNIYKKGKAREKKAKKTKTDKDKESHAE